MNKKDLGISDMNGMTQEDDHTCALMDMNCLDAEKEEKPLGIKNMNALANDDDTTCGLKDMNCLDEK